MELNRTTRKYLIPRDRAENIHDDFSKIGVLDEHAKNGTYKVRSLYFDDDELNALKDRVAQKDNRRKYRIRLYNDDLSYIKLEEKVKIEDIGTKTDVILTEDQVQKILDNDIDWMRDSDNELIQRFYQAVTESNIKPKVIVQYIREPFTHSNGTTRMTLDYDIKALKDVDKFLDDSIYPDDLIDDQAVIEIKWQENLDDDIKHIIEKENLEPVNFSKYTSTVDYLTNE